MSSPVPKLSVVYLSSRPPFPLKGGRERVIAQSIGFLAAEFDVHVVVFCRNGETADLDQLLRMGCRSVQTMALPGLVEVARNFMTRRGRALQEHLFFARRARSAVHALVSAGVSVVVADMLRTAQYCEGLAVPKVIDLDDLLSERYRQLLANGCRQAVFGTFGERIAPMLRRIEPFVRRRVLEWERSAVAKRELDATRQFDVTLLTSEREAQCLRGASRSTQVFPNPQATRLPPFVWQRGTSEPDRVSCFFMGNLRTSQNLSSLALIADGIAPRMRLRGLPIHLHVVGDYDERALRVLHAMADSVTLHGFVADYAPIVMGCAAALMPIAEGTGVKTKVLDAMAMGIPVVTNRRGVEGLEVENGSEALVGDTPEEMTALLERLIGDETLCAHLSLMGRRYVAERHDPALLHVQFQRHVLMAIESGRARVYASIARRAVDARTLAAAGTGRA